MLRTGLAAWLRRLHRNQRGQVLVLMIAVTTVFLFMGVFAVDLGMWLVERRDHQNDADAAAFAGAQELLNRNNAADMTARAVQKALEWGARNAAPEDTFVNGTPEVVDQCWDAPAFDGLPDGVTVQVSRQGASMFTALWNQVAPSVGARATVCVGSPSQATGVLPFGIPTDPTVNPNCFDTNTGAPLFGATCDISVRAPEGDSGETGTLILMNDGSTECSKSERNFSQTLQQTFISEVAYGADTTCATARPGANCSTQQYVEGVGSCVWSLTGNRASWTIEGLQIRLSREGECDSLYPDASMGGVNDGVDQWWEALAAAGGTPPSEVVPGPDVTFLPLECAAPRLVTLILIHRFDEQGQCNGCPVRGFAAFYIAGCRDEDNNFNSRCITRNSRFPSLPGEPKLKNTGQLYLEGMFINYVDIAPAGGPLNQFGIMSLFLVE